MQVGSTGFDAVLSDLRRLYSQGIELFTVHYACENLARVRAAPPGISAIALHNIVSDEEVVFSRIDRPEDQEQYVLSSFFTFVRERPGCRLVHWNMNSSDFGFSTLANRYFHVVGNEPPIKDVQGTFCLSEIIAAGYGQDFADDPKLRNTIDRNGLRCRHFLSGKEEADRFDQTDHGAIRASVAEKVGLLSQLARLLLAGDLETKHSGKRLSLAGATVDSVQVVRHLALRFRDVSRQLERRHSKRGTLNLTDEYDYQDLLHSLLRIFFDDVRAEQYTETYAGGAARIDFLIPAFRLGIELKHGAKLTIKELADQLIIDIKRYKNHKVIRHLVCVVFDETGNLVNPRGVESDLSKPFEGMAVTVIIVDR